MAQLRLELIFVSSRPVSCTDALGPSVKARRGADEVGLALKGHTAGGLGVFEVVDGRDVLVGERRVGQRRTSLEVLVRRQVRLQA